MEFVNKATGVRL